MADPNHQVTWRRTRPEFSITYLHGTSTNRGYHESFFEVVSTRGLSAEDFAHLDACGFLGMGQAYHIQKSETFTETVQPTVIDQRTGKLVECSCKTSGTIHDERCSTIPRDHRGEPFTTTHDYEWHRYVVLRICDSGD